MKEPKFTRFEKRHFAYLASWMAANVASERKGSYVYPAKAWAKFLANSLSSTNPRFNKAKFLSACGLTEQEQESKSW